MAKRPRRFEPRELEPPPLAKKTRRNRYQEDARLSLFLIDWVRDKDRDALREMPEPSPEVGDEVSPLSAWLLAKLVKVDPEGLSEMLTCEIESLEEAMHPEDFEWTQKVIQAIQKAFWEADSSEPYETDMEFAARFKFQPPPREGPT